MYRLKIPLEMLLLLYHVSVQIENNFGDVIVHVSVQIENNRFRIDKSASLLILQPCVIYLGFEQVGRTNFNAILFVNGIFACTTNYCY